MDLVLLYSVVLVIAVLLSGLAKRSVLSTTVVFLVAGVVFGSEVLGFVDIRTNEAWVKGLAEVTLFTVLFTDGMRVGIRDLLSAWRIPGRALLLGMPLAFLFTAPLAHYLCGLPWQHALLLAAILAPTDPVFAEAIVGMERTPYRLRRLLNVESGINDGLALPVVILLLAWSGNNEFHVGWITAELVAGIAIGVIVPWIVLRLEASRFFSATTRYQPINVFAIGLLVLMLAWTTHANKFLAAFAAGITVASSSPAMKEAFHRLGEMVGELLKLLAILVFGLLISSTHMSEIAIPGYLFAILVLFAIRPLAICLALLGSSLPWRQQLAAAWFGPKGFASVVYALLILEQGLSHGMEIFHLAALVVAASVILHSSTDVIVGKWISEKQPESSEELELEVNTQ